MVRLFKRMWAYMTAAGAKKFDEHADPTIQIQQAITKARRQHNELTEQAANVIATQRQAEMALSNAIKRHDELASSLERAVSKANDDPLFEEAVNVLANQLVQQEQAVEFAQSHVNETGNAADAAKAELERNSARLQQKLMNHQRLLSQVEQVKMAEQMNAAMRQLEAGSLDDKTPSLDSVQSRLEARYAKAIAHKELHDGGVQGRLRQVEQAGVTEEANKRIEQVRERLQLRERNA